MSLIVIVIIVQAVSSTLAWLGFSVGIRALPGTRTRPSRWIIGSAVVAAAWLVGVFLLGAAGNDVLPPRIPVALGATLLVGYLLLLSPTFRRVVAAVPQHWLIGIQAFRILGAVWLVRYFRGRAARSVRAAGWHRRRRDRIARALRCLCVAWRQALCTQRRDRVEPLRYGRSCQCRGAGNTDQRRRWRHRLPAGPHSGLWRSARVPHPLVFTDRPAAQNLAAAATSGVAESRGWAPPGSTGPPSSRRMAHQCS